MNINDITKYIDLTPPFSPTTTKADIDFTIDLARKYQFATVFIKPSWIPYFLEKTKDAPIRFFTAIAGETGQESMDANLAQIAYAKKMGTAEIDMVMDLGAFKSGMYEKMQEDFITIKKAMGETPLKIIIEAPLLSDEEIIKASEMVLASGAEFVKMNLGPHGISTPRQTKLVKDFVGDRALVKACGVDDLDIFIDLLDYGIARFGIGTPKVLKLIEQAEKR